MSTFQKVALGIVGIGLVTTLILPDRKTSSVIDSISNLFRGSLATAMNVTKR